MTARWRVAIGVLAATCALRVIYGAPRLGYDAWFALSWGRDIAHGHNPGFSGPMAPTPHPLANAVSALVSLLGSGAVTAVATVSLLSFAALGVATFLLGARLFGAPAGVLVAALVLTRPLLVDEMLFSSGDVPFLALVSGAGALLVAQRPRVGPALALVVLAGLLRPEGWLLAIALAGWAWWRDEGPDRRRLVVAVVLAPLLWALFDLVVTGDPLHSLHGTQDLAQEFGRPRSTSTAVTAIPRYVRTLLGTPVAWAGAISALAALWLALERAALPLAVAGLGLLGFLALGVADLPLLYRYALLPGLAMVLLIGFGAFAWSTLGVLGMPRWALAGFGAFVLAMVASGAGHDRRELRAVAANNRVLRAAQLDLGRLTDMPDVRAAVHACRRVAVPGPRAVPELAYRLSLRAQDVLVAQAKGPLSTSAFSPTAGRVADGYTLTSSDHRTLTAEQVSRLSLIARNASWRAYGC
jgi:hypothetical protein